MSMSRNTTTSSSTHGADKGPADSDQQRNNTLTRIRAALLEDRLSAMALTEENTGNDPYNSGVHRALGKATVWTKRSR
jgi:hypothetical protein